MADKKINKKNKKNKKSYDNKLITWISVGLGAFVAVVLAIVLIITLTTGYIAKVDGLKIYEYEQQTKDDCDRIAKNLIGHAIQRCAADHLHENVYRFDKLDVSNTKCNKSLTG